MLLLWVRLNYVCRRFQVHELEVQFIPFQYIQIPATAGGICIMI
jgi:hypothetical protein